MTNQRLIAAAHAANEAKPDHRHFSDVRTFRDGFRHCQGCGAVLLEIINGKEIYGTPKEANNA